jgi:CRISPR-associated protein Csd1
MILQELSRYYKRLLENPEIEICEPGFSPEKISFRIVISKGGDFLNLEDLREPDDKKNLISRIINVPKFDGKRASGIKSYFLWDKSHYTIGIKSEDSIEKETPEHQKAFMALMDEIVGENYDDFPMAKAVRQFCLNKKNLSKMRKHPHWEDFLNSFAVFEVKGSAFQTIFDDPHILDIWRKHYQKSATGKKMVKGLCLVSGELGSLTVTHPTIKKGIGGKNDIPLVSCNFDAGESYNKRKGENAPVSSLFASYFTGALNYLIDNNSNNILMGDTRVLFWAENNKKSESFFGSVFDNQKRDETTSKELKVYLKSIQKGKVPEPLNDSSKFFVLGLAPNSARVSVRFWYVDTVRVLAEKIGRHIKDLEIVKMFPDKETDMPTIWQLLLETAVRKESKNILSTLSAPLMRSILSGGKYPNNILSLLIARLRHDQDDKNKGKKKIGTYRAAFIKAILNRNYNKELTVALDKERKSVPYSLGRLFAVLEKIQEDSADGEINATIKDRYFSSASATPKVVFPTLIRLSQNNQKKLKGKNPGNLKSKEILLGEIMNNLSDFPATLKLENQGEFSIGYYHQRQDFFTKKEK